MGPPKNNAKTPYSTFNTVRNSTTALRPGSLLLPYSSFAAALKIACNDARIESS